MTVCNYWIINIKCCHCHRQLLDYQHKMLPLSQAQQNTPYSNRKNQYNIVVYFNYLSSKICSLFYCMKLYKEHESCEKVARCVLENKFHSKIYSRVMYDLHPTISWLVTLWKYKKGGILKVLWSKLTLTVFHMKNKNVSYITWLHH